MNRKSKVIISIVGITIVLLALLGITYAYYLTRIEGNTNTNSISITTANLLLTYNDGNGSLNAAESLQPGMDVKFLDVVGNVVDSKIFSITNNGNSTVKDYAVVLEDVINMFERPEDMQMTLTCTSSISGKVCNGRNGDLPNKNDVLVLNSIDQNEVQTYELKLTYIEAGVDQSADMGKSISAKINIYNSQDTVDIEGTVESYAEGDYIQVNSVPKKSQIGLDNKYKVVGVLPGNHTISLYNKDGVLKGSKEFKVTQGEVAGVDGDIITIEEESRTVNLDLNSDYSINIDSNISNTAHGSSYSLASVIVNNAKNVTSSQKSKGYAEFLTTPKTTPALDESTKNESVLSITEDDYGNSYYFRGNVKNNFVNFAGKCWRVVRLQGDGSTKLILDDANAECNSESYTGNWSIGQSSYGANGYLNSTDGLKNKFDTWYSTNLLSEQNSLKNETICLGDLTTKYNEEENYNNEWYQSEYGKTSPSYFELDSLNRMKNNNVTLKCKGESINNQYIYPISSDEVAFAGAKFSYGFWDFGDVQDVAVQYHYLVEHNDEKEYPSFWTLTLSSFGNVASSPDEAFNYNAFRVGRYGMLVAASEYGYSNSAIHLSSDPGLWYEDEVFIYVARPMVTLISGISLNGGDGSRTNPYKIN